MPHDIYGNELKVGDRVTIPVVVTAINAGSEGYCNLTVDTEHPMFPETRPSVITLNARQVELVRDPAEATA